MNICVIIYFNSLIKFLSKTRGFLKMYIIGHSSLEDIRDLAESHPETHRTAQPIGIREGGVLAVDFGAKFEDAHAVVTTVDDRASRILELTVELPEPVGRLWFPDFISNSYPLGQNVSALDVVASDGCVTIMYGLTGQLSDLSEGPFEVPGIDVGQYMIDGFFAPMLRAHFSRDQVLF